MTASNITQFRELIFSDYELTTQLYSITATADFIATSIDIALANGITLTEVEVATAINAGSRRWLERWI